MDKKDGGTIDLESLLEVRDYFADRQDAEQLAGESFPTPNEEMRLLFTVDSVLAELTARRARDAEVEALVAAAHRAEVSFNTVRGCYERNPGNFMLAMNELEADVLPLRAAIAPFTGAKP